MKLPNNYGSITKLKGNRNRPYMVREGKSGKQRILTYTATYEEGLAILAQFNNDPWSVVQPDMTFQEVFELMLEKRVDKFGKATLHSLKSVVKYCDSLKDKSYREIKAYLMQDCIDQCGRGYATQNAIKNLFYHTDRFAIELDISSKNFSSILTTETVPESKKTVFSQQERDILWKNKKIPWVDSILIFLFTGLRISELLELKKEQVDLVEGTITGGKKTKAGKNRIIPIHSKILPLIKNRMVEEGDFLFSYRGNKVTESTYRKIWSKLMGQFCMKHCPHECRHTFRSLLDSVGANKVCIDRMMGHKSVGTGERTYTHKGVEELRKNLELVTS